MFISWDSVQAVISKCSFIFVFSAFVENQRIICIVYWWLHFCYDCFMLFVSVHPAKKYLTNLRQVYNPHKVAITIIFIM